MTPHREMLWLFAGLGMFLTLASITGQSLKHRRDGAASTVVQNLNGRITAWWVMVALIGLAFLFGTTGVILLFGFASFTAMREFVTLTPTRAGDHHAIAAAFFVVLPAQFGLVAIGWYGLYSILIPVYVFLGLPIIAALSGDTTRFLDRIAELQWGLMISVFCVSHVPALLTLDIPGFEGRNLLLLAFFVLVVQSSDVLQYIWGKLFGRRQVAPRLSPSKTWEGLIGGVLSATALGGALHALTPFAWWQAGAMALAIAAMGFLGGLVMSAIKRDRGVKDWGQMIEGHGGMLDRLDSIVFAAPVFFHLTRFWWTP